MSFTPGMTIRWTSPELLDPERFGSEGDRPTRGSDCYAFGMVIYEVGVSVGDPRLHGLNIYTGILRPCPIPRHPTGTCNNASDLGGAPTKETEERDGPGIYGIAMGNRRKVLGGRSERTTGCKIHSFSSERGF